MDVSLLDMPILTNDEDSYKATLLMKDLGVNCIITLGEMAPIALLPRLDVHRVLRLATEKGLQLRSNLPSETPC